MKQQGNVLLLKYTFVIFFNILFHRQLTIRIKETVFKVVRNEFKQKNSRKI